MNESSKREYIAHGSVESLKMFEDAVKDEFKDQMDKEFKKELMGYQRKMGPGLMEQIELADVSAYKNMTTSELKEYMQEWLRSSGMSITDSDLKAEMIAFTEIELSDNLVDDIVYIENLRKK